MFMYSSTCFGRSHAHYKEIRSSTTAVAASGFTVERGGSSAVGRGRAGRHCYHHAPTVKPEAATAVVELLMMGVRKPETC